MCWIWRKCKSKLPRNLLCQTIRNDGVSRYGEMCHMPKRNRPKSPWSNAWFLEKIVGDWLLSGLLPRKLLWWQLGFVSVIRRWSVQTWLRPWEWSKGVSSPWPYHWEMRGGQSSLCWLLIQMPNVSAYRRGYLFYTVIGIWGGPPIGHRMDYWQGHWEMVPCWVDPVRRYWLLYQRVLCNSI